MPHFVTPNSHGTLREINPCHDPATGKFAARGSGNCGPMTAIENDLGGRTALKRAVRERISSYVASNKDTFSIERALDIAGPAFKDGYLALMEKAPGAHAEMTRTLDRVLTKVNGVTVPYEAITESGQIHGSMGGIKGARRLIEKTVLDNFGDLTQARDVVRSSIAVEHAHQIPAVLAAIRGSFTVVREKDRMTAPAGGGYRDHLFNVRLKNGLVGEVQVHVKPMLRAKETQGHALYQRLRTTTSRVMAAGLTRKMSALYNSAWGVFLATAAVGLASGGRRA